MNALPSLGISRHNWKFLCNTRWRRRFIASFDATHEGIGRQLAPPATARQMRTASAILDRLRAQKGILLADDVGTGKTTVAAWVILVFALQSKDIRVLAPNRSMRRRWEEEIEWQFKAYAVLAASGQPAKQAQILKQLRKYVRFKTHGTVTKADLQKDLLVIDEVHRAKNENTKFARRIRKVAEGTRLLVLTATPFSLSINELSSLLKRIGAPADTLRACRALASKLEALWTGCGIGQPVEFANELVVRLKMAHRAIRELVFRTSVDELGVKEKRLYGHKERWNIAVTPATPQYLQLLAELDRLGQIGGLQHHHNDPRYHQGWGYIAQVLRCRRPVRGDAGVFRFHRKAALQLSRGMGDHPKIDSVAKAIQDVVAQGEKVVVFCDYHATAGEVAVELAQRLGQRENKQVAAPETFQKVLATAMGQHPRIQFAPLDDRLTDVKVALKNYCAWFASPGMAAQVTGWIHRPAGRAVPLEEQLTRLHLPGSQRAVGLFLEEAVRLFLRLLDRQSRSTRSQLIKHPIHLPGRHRFRVTGLCDPPKMQQSKGLSDIFAFGEPDTVMAVFNSPFGPEVLVTTDRLSEGVDLHRFCRHLVHYELDPSPLRVIQREGRIRRIGSWAALTRRPVTVSSPALQGTRDARLVAVVANRLQQFDLLLGGVNQEVNHDLHAGSLDDQNAILKLVRQHPRLSLKPKS
jgi:hypothetical protein